MNIKLLRIVILIPIDVIQPSTCEVAVNHEETYVSNYPDIISPNTLAEVKGLLPQCDDVQIADSGPVGRALFIKQLGWW